MHQKLPLQIAHLETFYQVAQSTSSYDNFLFVTILSCAFYACHHIGKFVQKNDRSLFDWHKIIKCSSLKLEDGCAQYHLPYYKADPLYQGTDILFTEQEVADHIILLSQYCCHGECTALWLCHDSKHPTHSWFEQRFFTTLNHDFGGQSAHAGGANFLAALRLSEFIIQKIG